MPPSSIPPTGWREVVGGLGGALIGIGYALIICAIADGAAERQYHMTALVWVLIGAGALLVLSALEDVSLPTAFRRIVQPDNRPPGGSEPATPGA